MALGNVNPAIPETRINKELRSVPFRDAGLSHAITVFLQKRPGLPFSCHGSILNRLDDTAYQRSRNAQRQ